MIIHDVLQGSDEWFELRKLKMTASHATEIIAAGKGLGTYTDVLVSEYYSNARPDRYTNKEMQRGIELEAEARTIYEFENDVEVKQIGFIEYNAHAGISPDGNIALENWGIEIKAHNDKVYTQLAIHNKIDTKYLNQIQMQLFVTGWNWIDFVAYNPNYKKTMYTKRIVPNKEKFEKIALGLNAGEILLREKIQKMEEFINESN